MNVGWLCPRCNIVNAPHMDMCKNCTPDSDTSKKCESSFELLDNGFLYIYDDYLDTYHYGNLSDCIGFKNIKSIKIDETTRSSVIIEGTNRNHVFRFTSDYDAKLFVSIMKGYVEEDVIIDA